MILSMNWLRDYLQKPEAKIDVHDLAEKLTMRGLAVASIRTFSSALDNVVVARIEKIEKHPNADRLQVTQVVTADGPDAQRRQIVCGAKNIAEGDIVPVALPGCILPGDFEIKVSTIRGVESFGMICSAKELGIEEGEPSEGILQLPKHAHLGEPVSRLLGKGQEDTLVEFELTPNRGDCLSVMGLAREIMPLIGNGFREPKPARFKASAHRTSSIINVVVDDPALCPRYVARVIDELKISESPDWIKQRLEAVGLRPINNIVDFTNFVMMEYGQPLHAFDLRKIQSGTVRVGPVKERMDFTLINDQTVQLEPGDIVIWDGDRPIALAGIMGGQNSQVAPDTTSIFLESAAFSPSHIRRTAKRLGLSTDSSKRFEKGSDPVAVMLASERCAALMRDVSNGNVYHPPIDTNEEGVKENIVAVDMREVRKVTGLKNISSETVTDLLESVGITTQKRSINILQTRLPSYRYDLKESVDVIEEVARMAGYDTIPLTYPISTACFDKLDESQFEFEGRAKNILTNLGLRETIHYSFTSDDNLNRFGFLASNAVRVKNPISEEMKTMRTSLLPSLLQTYLYNHNRKITDQRMYEVAKTYYWEPQEETRVKETPFVAGLISGNLLTSNWKSKGETVPVDFYHGKGIVETLTRQLTTVFIGYEPLKESKIFHPGRSAVLKLGLKEVGWVGEVHPFIRQSYLDTDEAVVMFELNLEVLKKYERSTIRYKTPSKFPAKELDIAIVVDKSAIGQQLFENIKHNGGQLLTDIQVFDVYEGANLPEGKKSVAFHLAFSSPERTLQDGEVNECLNKITAGLAERFGATLRS